jgi:topoisomerase-4 subunit A
LKGHQEQSSDDKYREGDRARFWFHAQTTDQIMLLSTDGRFFTLDGSKLPGGRGNGEAIRSFIDLPPEADIVTDVRAMCRAASCWLPPPAAWLHHQ